MPAQELQSLCSVGANEVPGYTVHACALFVTPSYPQVHSKRQFEAPMSVVVNETICLLPSFLMSSSLSWAAAPTSGRDHI